MARYEDTAEEGIRERSGWLIPLGVFLVTFALAALFLLFYLAPSPPSFFHEPVSFTARGDIVVLKVHSRAFYVPANYLKYRSDRQGGDRRDIKLVALLPDMQGYSDWDDSTFKSNAADAATVEMLIHDDSVRLSEGDWFRRIYGPYIKNANGSSAPYGLTRYEFRNDSGYRAVDLYVGKAATGIVTFQCERFSLRVPSPNCHREMVIARGVALSYRFKRAHLARWRSIADGVSNLIKSFEAKPSK